MKTGLKKAASLAKAEDVILAMDADNSHDSYQFKQMLAKIEAGDDVGDRLSFYQRGGG